MRRTIGPLATSIGVAVGAESAGEGDEVIVAGGGEGDAVSGAGTQPASRTSMKNRLKARIRAPK